MKINEVLTQLRHHYKEHLSYCKQITNEIAAYMSNEGLGCTVFINDNLQIEIQYNIPRGGNKPIPKLRRIFYNTLAQLCEDYNLIEVESKSVTKRDFCLPEPYTDFYTEKVVLDIEVL